MITHHWFTLCTLIHDSWNLNQAPQSPPPLGTTHLHFVSSFLFSAPHPQRVDIRAIMVIAAVGQICATSSLTHNLEQCVRLISKASVGGARVGLSSVPQERQRQRQREGENEGWRGLWHSIHMSLVQINPPGQVLFLPEASDYIASNSQESLSLARPESESPFVRGIQAAAKDHCISISVGIHAPVSIPDPSASCGGPPETVTKLFNRSLWINSDGSINRRATYDKLHLFDYGSLRESATVQSGRRLTEPFSSPVGRIGSLICFDLRFPEPSLALAQPGPGSPWASSPAEVLLYPSAFTVRTGAAHWETLLRARAIETQSWVIAAAQVGRHNATRSSYGHSMVVDPWGTVKLELGGVDDEGEAVEDAAGAVGFVDIDLDEVVRVRESMPLMRRM
ncbi:hypothetical protein ACRALDRAFT_206451 [Sodiomyces alcalophilus JCM 7366]|uniref:uncharacterized protein n=1 Tax=Sodiomyces alcalophilus JCM 7366 TaxID=591952 RepID=UPI0039B3C0A2